MMIGFGFMDNLVMIQVGDYLDTTIGVTFGLATLTAAGFGQVAWFLLHLCRISPSAELQEPQILFRSGHRCTAASPHTPSTRPVADITCEMLAFLRAPPAVRCGSPDDNF